MKHELKIEKQYLDRVLDRTKTFEIRKNDRDYQKGDKVTFKEVKAGNATGKEATADIGYVTDYQQKEGYVVFSLANVLKTKDEEAPKTDYQVFLKTWQDMEEQANKTAFEIYHAFESKMEEANRRASVDDSQGRCEKCGEKTHLEQYHRTKEMDERVAYRPIWLCKVCGPKVANYARVKEKTIAEQIDELVKWDEIPEGLDYFQFDLDGNAYAWTQEPNYHSLLSVWTGNYKHSRLNNYRRLNRVPDHLRGHYKESLRKRPVKEAKK
jgi:rubrerythrin